MFEENKNNIEQDLIFRSILEEGMEPAPAHVWDRIEEDLDRIAQRRRTVLWFRRTAVGVAAAAALALGLFMDWSGDGDIVSPVTEEGMIAVVEDTAKPVETEIEVNDLMAMAEKPRKTVRKAIQSYETIVSETPSASEFDITPETEVESPVETVNKPKKNNGEKEDNSYDNNQSFNDFWPEDETSRHKTGVSLVISGITGTNSAQNGSRVPPMRRPGISAAPQKTGIKETSTNTTYGIPVSVGAGVKIDFAPRWSVGVGLNYSLLSRKFYGTYTRVGESGNILKDVSSDIRATQHYIGIPVNVYYDIVNSDRISFYTYAGGTAEKCVADKYQVLNTDITHTEKVKGMQLSANIGMGAEFMVGKHLGIYIDPSLRYYFDNDQPKSIRTAQPLMFGFEMGLRARL